MDRARWEADIVSAIDWTALEALAIATRTRAYAPYSHYRVGAAVMAEDGSLFGGCNVENASYGLSNCAERTAVFGMVAAGHRRIVAAAVVTAGPEAGSPCGACRQVLAEMCDDAPVHVLAVDERDQVIDRRVTTVSELLPGKFRGDLVTATKQS